MCGTANVVYIHIISQSTCMQALHVLRLTLHDTRLLQPNWLSQLELSIQAAAESMKAEEMRKMGATPTVFRYTKAVLVYKLEYGSLHTCIHMHWSSGFCENRCRLVNTSIASCL